MAAVGPAARPSAVGRWPLPEALRSTPRTTYVGRHTERERVDRAQVRARSGQRQLVLLAGEPGIGKTRLASYSAREANADGFAVCWGACSEDVTVPYGPWIAVCSQMVEHLDHETLAAHVARFGSDVGRLATNLRLRLPDAPPPQTSDPETERFLLFRGVAELVRTTAESTALCVVLDDFHWADRESVSMLRHLASTVERGALLVLLTYRDTDVDERHPLVPVLADLGRTPGVERVALAGLDAVDVAELLSAAAGHDLDVEALTFAAEVTAEAGGNPFFVGEIVRSLMESGAIGFEESSGRWVVDRARARSLPDGVRDVISRRVSRLGDQTRAALVAGAVIGRSFDLELAARVLDTTEDDLLDQLDSAVGAALLQESREHVGRFRFVHALINQTLYDQLSPTRRARTHARIGAALEELHPTGRGDRLGELALHWRLAGAAGDSGRAAQYAASAARHALDHLAPADAVRLYRDALGLLPPTDDETRCRVLVGLGTALQLTGDAAYRDTLLEASRIASTIEHPELAAAAALANTRGFQSLIGALDEPRAAAIERAIELDDGSDVARRAQLFALKSQELLYDHERGERQGLAREAIELARGLSDTRAAARILQHAFHGLWSPDMVALRCSLADELLARARAAQDQTLEFWAIDLLSHVGYETGDFARAAWARERQQQLVTELGQPTPVWVTKVRAAGWELMRGDLAGAEERAKEGLAAGQAAGQPDALQIYGEQRAMARVFRGRGDASLIELAAQARHVYPRMGIWAASQAYYEALFGDVDVAARLLREAVETRLDRLGWDTLRLPALAFYCEAAARVGDRDAAALVHELLSPFADQFAWGGATGYGHVRLWLGVAADTLGRGDEAEDHLGFACRFHEEHGLGLWHARSELAAAEALATRGEPGRAGHHARRATALAEAGGAALITDLAAPLALHVAHRAHGTPVS